MSSPPVGAREIPMPRRLVALIDCARDHGWTVETSPLVVEGCDVAWGVGFAREISDGRMWLFATGFGRSDETGRWQALSIDGPYRVVGELIEPTMPDGTTPDIVRRWRAIRDLEHWIDTDDLDGLQDAIAAAGAWPARRTFRDRITEAASS